ncbi:bifunctional 2',3'-cyclic-nucleotide 2'-phosphodiesterase/3'-nucleotidase [Paenibacillus sp. P96]|uniref:Bifunctional 2',3'-cyclic-nucleotide 2'-phosphodiesterase/3'-nucleotidase n=1 Tax=Paenibacillus zeirhizosphaerae TaxID=2987519 RepID=A0ABT9FMS5_9BACL|nr:bifunctional 2',3'-cyclic-nucleotide 2'-phosphodiesterase/3'-nucleotidase [Paenibacillus sp. P96]MDP4096022.1 bifunctional 2',3'-cyclic-nucleotide 2'-phosphodiesterase/3'-nucleotidase [Paenibacillus sp. P96]
MKFRKKGMKGLAAAVVAFNVLALPAVPTWAAEDNATVKLRIMQTTDLHVNLVNYDYYTDKPTDEYGLAKTATLIKQARAEAENSMLFDSGDLIQGNPLGDYVAKIDPLQDGEVHPVYKAMNLLDYDAATLGNHEFNYGLDFLQKTLKGAEFPYINANVYTDDGDEDESNDKNYFTPYRIIDKKVVDEDGTEHTLRVGVIGLLPPQINLWDEAHLSGKVVAKDIVATAEKFVPQMKADGADIVVALVHSGYEDTPQTPNMENAVKYLSEVDGIDSILFGHAHKVFPSAAFEGMAGVDVEAGTINGLPSVESGYWGDNLGVVDLELELKDGKWTVADSQSAARPIYDKTNKASLAEPDPAVVEAVYEEHAQTLEYVRGPVGTTTAPINSFFALVQDDPSIQIVTNAQKWYVEKKLAGTEYEGLPVLSAGAPFKAGGRSGASYYTNIPAGTIAIKNVADLYVYPNTVYAVRVTGAEVKEWLEWSAGQFNQIQPGQSGEQQLINNDFPTYNFDVMDGVTYQIDVTEPVKYDGKGSVVNASANRIKNLQYDGKPIDPEQEFIVATNNYRASSSKLANPDGQRIIMAAPDENRQVIIDYINENGSINPSADGNWSIAPFGDAEVTFVSSPAAQSLTAQASSITYTGAGENGFAKYKLLSAEAAGETAEPAAPVKPTTPVTPETGSPVKPSPAKPPVSSSGSSYTIQKGDNLYRIALKFGVSWEEIAELNGIQNVHRLQIGQTIQIP